MTSTMMTVEPMTRFTPGAVESILNYWLTKIGYDDSGEKTALPECNLDDSSCEPLLGLTRDAVDQAEAQGLHSRSAFEAGYLLGVALTIAIAQDPLGNPTPAMREALAETIASLREAVEVP